MVGTGNYPRLALAPPDPLGEAGHTSATPAQAKRAGLCL